jgi:hypothetical protein
MLVESDGSLPPLEYMSVKNARLLLDSKDYKYRIIGDGEFVQQVKKEENLYILTSGIEAVKMEVMPRLTGLSIREALRKVDFAKFRVVIDGEGIVRKQSIRTGDQVKAGTSLYLTCN